MTPAPTDRDDREPGAPAVASIEMVLDTMAPLEPYTTTELAGLLDLPARLVRRLLERLVDDGAVRRKRPDPDTVLWIREPPSRRCQRCGRAFEVKYLHAVLSSVHYCPRCGSRL